MLPLIDIVFLLLIFFLVAFQPVDLQTLLEANMPQGKPGTASVPTLHIAVGPDAYLVNHRAMDLQEMDRILSRLSAVSPDQTVVVASTPSAPHGRLIEVLDLCSKVGLNSISLMSLNNEL